MSQLLDHMPIDAATSGNMVGEIQDIGTCEPFFVAFKKRQ